MAEIKTGNQEFLRKNNFRVNRLTAVTMVCLLTLIFSGFYNVAGVRAESESQTQTQTQAQAQNSVQTQSSGETTPAPDQLIRFHVLANSDSDEDQALKRAVRDAILVKLSPKLAASHSLAESRQIVRDIRPEIEEIGRSVVKSWGKDYTVRTEYGHFSFPTKSYGTLVLPAGDYEALRVVIGAGKGSNWWCVLFPPLCFVDIDHSTAVQVDGKPGIPINTAAISNPGQAEKSAQAVKPVKEVHFYFWDLIQKLFEFIKSL